MIKPRYILFLVLGGIILSSAARGQQVHTFTVQGGATVEGNNYALARSKGLTDAYKKALALALTEILGAKTMEGKARLIGEHFYQDPSKFVSRYKMLSEQFAGEIYSLNAEVDLSPDKIKIELVQAGLDRAKNQSVVLVVFEEEGAATRSSWLNPKSEQSFAEKLMALEVQRWGYRLVKPEAVFDPEKLEKNIADKSWLAQSGEKYNARFIIAGTDKLILETKEIPPEEKNKVRISEAGGSGIYAATSRLEINLVDVDTGEKLSFQKTGQAASDTELSEASSRATEQAVRSILPDLSLAMERLGHKGRAAEGKGQKSVIEILGVGSYFTYQELMEGLKKVDGLGSAELWGFAPGKVMVTVQYSGDQESVKTLIAGHQFPEFKLLPIESEKQDLRFKLEPLK